MDKHDMKILKNLERIRNIPMREQELTSGENRFTHDTFTPDTFKFNKFKPDKFKVTKFKEF